MTRPNPLVMDGSEVKLRLEAERTAHGSFVHVDWVRFTCLLRNSPAADIETLFPSQVSVWDENYRSALMQKVLRDIPDSDFVASSQAYALAQEVAAALGSDFVVHTDIGKGHDFYRFRWSIHRFGCEVGWIGFLSSGDSPRQQAQANTIHANIYGSACTFASHGWNHRIADIVDSHDAKLTRADLALDFFDGGIDMEQIKTDYLAGLMDSGGKRLKCNVVGDWPNGKERSFYIGSKEAGKQTNIYEKGHQIFGAESLSEWVRIELRYGNKLRVLPSDLLRRPGDFFSGASDWHASSLARCVEVFAPAPVKTISRLATETVQAEVTRNVRWAVNTAAPTLAAAFEFMGDSFLELVTNKKLPGRLQKFSRAELSKAFASVFSTVEGARPAFA